MAQTSWTRSMASFFMKKAVAPGLSPKSCLEFSRQCLEEVRTMTSPRESKSSEVINYEQCVYLVDNLDKAVEAASLFLEHNCHHGGNSVSTEDVRESTLEHLKILCILGKRVKCFIHDCCSGPWLHAAVILTNLSDYTASLGFDLKLFAVLLPPSSESHRKFPFTIGDVFHRRQLESELVKEMASKDENGMVTKLRALIQYGQASNDDLEVATFLLERLDRFRQSLPSFSSGWMQPILTERNLTNLKDMVQIGRGGYGTVFKASWLGIDVAAKIFYLLGYPYFLFEVPILAGLSHPNIVSFLFHGKDKRKCFIVMELMDQDLLSLMEERMQSDRTRSSPFSVFEEFDVMLQIAEAMDYLHGMRVVHRDLKPENILVRCLKSPNAEGYEYVQVKVSDFGLSRTKESILRHGQLTSNWDFPRWMAPELMHYWNTKDLFGVKTAKDENLVENYPFKCDVYSFGMVCFGILTGDVPFPNMRADAVKRAVHAGERPQLPDRCHEKLKALIEKCWNPVPGSRPNFGDICMELRYLKSLRLSCLSPKPFLKFSRHCLEEAQAMTSPSESISSEVVNYEQCVYLVDNLDKAVEAASLFLEHNRHHGGNSVSTEDVRESTLEHFKILCMFAKKVKCFTQGCCNGHWLQAVATSTNLIDFTASLGFDLKLFTVLHSPSSESHRNSQFPFTIGDVSDRRQLEGELVKEMASKDENGVVTKLKALIQYGQASNDDLELATFLLERLDRFRQSLSSFSSGWMQPVLGERDLTNLKDMVQIGRGGYGTVFKASWLGIDVAAKTFYGTENLEFMIEVPILAGLSHPNIVSFLCHGKDMGKCFIVMELMDRDLLSLMEERMRSDRTRSFPFSVFEEFDVMLQIAEAMDYLHGMRVVHRDLKSHNILVRCLKSPNAEGYEYVQVKVSDFGLSRTKEFSLTHSQMTPNTGTARWMAPELIKFQNADGILYTGTADENLVENYPFKCDIYSFGMVCLEILTGAVPFSNSAANAVKRAVCAGERPQLPDRCHEKLKALMEKCWNPLPGSRPSFGDICTELRHLKSLHMARKS